MTDTEEPEPRLHTRAGRGGVSDDVAIAVSGVSGLGTMLRSGGAIGRQCGKGFAGAVPAVEFPHGIGPAASRDQNGMPVDPSNLICLGRIGAVPALVLPGCARSPNPNGIDLVLARIFAALPLGPAEVMRMGVGGLLKDTMARPLPRARAMMGAMPGAIWPASVWPS